MANIYNNQFIDAVDRLNKMAYMLVNGNAKAWATKAVQLQVITYKERARIEQLVDLRNSMGHGNSMYINVGPNEVREVNKYVKIMNETATRIKTKRHQSPNKSTSKISGNSSYYQKM